MKIKARWKAGSEETHVGETIHEVGEQNAREMGQAIREHLMELAGTHFEFRSTQVILEVEFEPVT